jgi:GH15 family glucan-1,4-alpha-glucosidase
MVAGYQEEAESWRDWLLRAVAGDPADLQIMYGPAGERRLSEYEVSWLGGYEGASPVRIGNAAADQYQLDVYGEVMDALYLARERDIDPVPAAWDLQLKLMEFLESGWREPDDGIWEMRGPRRHFTHSKMMAWVAMDRAVRSVESFPGVEGPVDKWRALRQEIHDEVCAKGWNADVGAFTQYYGGNELDASLLLMPLQGFLPATDARVTGTIDAISRQLIVDGLVLRYRADSASHVDGLSGGEGAFLPCSFWLVENLALCGREQESRALFERLLGLANDLGLFAEEYDTKAGRQVGNFPQAFTHMSLVSAAQGLSGAHSRDSVRAK